MPGDLQKISSKLWDAADQLRANSNLKSSEYSVPVLGLIFLKFADCRFEKAKEELEKKASSRRTIGSAAYRAKGILFLPEKAQFSELMKLPEGADIGRAINEGMVAVEADNPELKDILPKNYNLFENRILVELLKTFNSIPMDIEGDAFGKIYEYFLGKFAMSEGQKGGEFFRELMEFAKTLSEEEKRAAKENLTEEELTIFDLLTKPTVKLTKKEELQVKKVAKELLDKLKSELCLDWRKKHQARESVKLSIEETLDGLPEEPFSKDLYQQKCNVVFHHVYESYYGQGQSLYSR
jgi:hypothetical protein